MTAETGDGAPAASQAAPRAYIVLEGDPGPLRAFRADRKAELTHASELARIYGREAVLAREQASFQGRGGALPLKRLMQLRRTAWWSRLWSRGC